MSLTQADLDQRLKFVGASEAAAVLGLDPYRSPVDVWLLKSGRVDSGINSDAADLGTRLEPIVLDWAQEQLGPLTRNVRAVREDLFLGATFDAMTDHGEPVEAKTSGLLGPTSPDWGDPGTDAVPERVIVQAHVQMILAPAKVCFVPALIGWRGLVMYRVDLNDDLAEGIVTEIPAWWRRHVVNGEPPEGTPTSSVLRRIKREAGKVEKVGADSALRYLDACAAAKTAEAAKEQAYAGLVSEFGDAEIGDFGDPKQWFTFKESWRSTLDAAALKADHPEIHAKYVRSSSSRSLRLANRPKASKGE